MVRAEIGRALRSRLEINSERVLAPITNIALGDVRDMFDEEAFGMG